MNPLDKYPAVRDVLYLIQWLASGVLLVITAVVLALGEQPVWLLAATAGFNAFTAFTGFTAQQNVAPDPGAGIHVVSADITDEEIAFLETEMDSPLDTVHGGTGYSGPPTNPPASHHQPYA